MKNFIEKIKSYFVAHKIISAIVLIIIVVIGYWGYGKITSTTGETRYVLSKATLGTIVSSVTGSGQVSASSQIDIKPNVSGTITSINVQSGDKVTIGKILFTIDSTNAQKTVRDAEISLQSAQISLDKLNIQNSNANTDASLMKVYDDGFNSVKDTFYDLNSNLNGIDTLLSTTTLSDNAARTKGKIALDYRNKAETSFYDAQTAFAKNNKDYAVLNNNSPKTDIKNIIQKTYNTTKLLSDAIKNTSNFVDYMAQNSNNSSNFTSYQTTLSSYTTTINEHLSNLLAAETNIQSNEDSSANNNLDNKSALLSLQQKQNALLDAKQALSDYYIRAPFDGLIASVPVNKGDNASSGTVLGTIITTQQVATISLNEVDIAKIQLGQKVTLTFDAVPDLTIAGKVTQIDSIGTVSQGVVNYSVKINFDTNDERIKPGMTANAAIITNVAQNILMVPNSAIKTTSGSAYVEMFGAPLPAPAGGVQGSPSATPPVQQPVTVGASDDTSTQIINGLNEGDEVVTKTIAGTSPSTSSTPSLLNAVGGNRGTTGAGARVLRGN